MGQVRERPFSASGRAQDRTIGVRRDLFPLLSLGDLPIQLERTVDDISDVPAVADALGILDAYYQQDKGNGPIVRSCETLRAQYGKGDGSRRSLCLYYGM